jgi:hypothetical protein
MSGLPVVHAVTLQAFTDPGFWSRDGPVAMAQAPGDMPEELEAEAARRLRADLSRWIGTRRLSAA